MFVFVQIALIPRFNSSLTFNSTFKLQTVIHGCIRFEATVEDNDDDDGAYL